MTLKILHIDDSAVSLRLLKKQLDSEQFVIYSAKDGRDGESMAKAVCPDIIIMDVTMPGINGIDAMIRMKKGVAKNIPIIILTSDTSDVLRHYAINNGCSSYIGKPASKDIIESEIKKALKVEN